MLTYRNIVVDEERYKVTRNGKVIPLRYLEYKLLLAFLKQPGMVITREDLLRQVWGDAYTRNTRTVDVHVSSLRRKLGLNKELATVYKIGYFLAEPKDE